MFDTNVVLIKAGHVGQVTRNGKVIWETEPFPSEIGVSPEDKLRRSQDFGLTKAYEAVNAKIDEVVERLFA